MGERFDDVGYVAVNDHVPESKENLLWILKNLQFEKLVLLHVHAPFSITTSSCGYQQSEIDAIKESQVKDLNSSFYKYRIICTSKRVNEEDVNMLCIAGYDVGEGIMKLIKQNNIKKLVMGAAADPHYSKKMSITSRKAKYVSEHAPRGCKMWFICKGKLITTKKGSVDLGNPSNSFSKFSPIKGGSDANNTEPPIEHPTGGHRRPNPADSPPSPPRAYKCPITWGIMRNPHVAADGYTYEEEAFRKHINEGNKNSPLTNEALENYSLIPNRTFHSVIKDWQQDNPNYED